MPRMLARHRTASVLFIGHSRNVSFAAHGTRDRGWASNSRRGWWPPFSFRSRCLNRSCDDATLMLILGDIEGRR